MTCFYFLVWQWLHWVQKTNPGLISVSWCTDWHLASTSAHCKALLVKWKSYIINWTFKWLIISLHLMTNRLHKCIPPTLKVHLFTAPTDSSGPWPAVQIWEWCGQTNGLHPEVHGSFAAVWMWPWVCAQTLPKREEQSLFCTIQDSCKFPVEWSPNCSTLFHI